MAPAGGMDGSSGEVSEWLKEHAWKVCKRLNRASGVRIPLSPPSFAQQVSMVAPSAPRDARSKTPPGPEGSNGIDRRGRRGQLAGPSPVSGIARSGPRFAAGHHRHSYAGSSSNAGHGMKVTLKRAYEPPSAGDGMRVLVDRLWPRGVSKAAAHIDLWLKDVAPSTALRKWFGHDPGKWPEFQKRYR